MKKIFVILMVLLSVTLFAENIATATSGNGEISVLFSFPENRHQTFSEDYFKLTLESDIIESYSLVYEDGKEEDGFINYYDSTTITALLTLKPGTEDGTYPVNITAHYQLCDENGTCFFPEKENLSVDYIVGGTEASTGNASSVSFISLLGLIIFSFLGGLILNIMPCVLPVLSIKAMGLVNQAKDKPKEILKGSLFYTAGIVSSLLFLALIVIIIKISGQAVGWGFQFQSTAYVLSLAVIIYVFALSLFDVFIINAPGMNAMTKASKTKGHTGSFLSGIFAVLLATPCSAPLLGSALGFAFSNPPLYIAISFLFIGLGLAFPFILIGFFPKVIRFIPKPGNWMNIFKEIMGFLLVGTALWLISVLYYLESGSYVIKTLIFFLVLTISAWLYGVLTKRNYSRKTILIALILSISISLISGLIIYSPNNSAEVYIENASYVIPGWEQFDDESFTSAAESETVFLAFGAKWCLTCQTNEAAVLGNNDFITTLKENDVRLIYGDFTKENPVIDKYIKGLGRAGVPVYALYVPGEKPILFPEIITKEMIYNEIK